MRIFIHTLLLIILSATTCAAQSSSGTQHRDIVYTTATDPYSVERCRLDIHIPEGEEEFTTIIWFHGGGLTGGNKDIPIELQNKGVAIVSASYRFAPQVAIKDIIRDAAAAVHWTYENIERYGGKRDKFVLGGYSAGAYLAMMLALDKSYLAAHNIDVDQMMGVVPVSGQTITHFAARDAMGIAEKQPLIDSLAPLFWVRADAPPMTLITGDRELEMLGRYEENAYLARMLRIVGHKEVRLYEIDGYDHGVTLPAYPILLKQVAHWTNEHDAKR